MNQYEVICAGLATIDLIAGILEPEALKRDTTYLETLSLQIGGDAVNQAVVLSRLGCRTGLMALCGSDYWGAYLTESLRNEGVDCSMVTADSGYSTTVSIVMLDSERERHFAVEKGSKDYFGLSHINLDMVKEAVEAGADIIMLDNMTPEVMKQAVELIDGRAQIECSGNITKENIQKIREIGVDFVSSGALTHSAPILDISMKNLHAV